MMRTAGIMGRLQTLLISLHVRAKRLEHVRISRGPYRSRQRFVHTSNMKSPGVAQEETLQALERDVETLRDIPVFGQYGPDAIGALQAITEESLFATVQERAPLIVRFLERLCRSSEWTTPDGHNRARIISLLSTICFSRHQRLCNYLPAVMSLLLHSSGAKKQIFDITNTFGWTESYKSVMGSVKGLRSNAVRFIQQYTEKPFVAVYDNCDISRGVSEQSFDKRGELISICSALLTPGNMMPDRGLWQSDFIRYPIGLPDWHRPMRDANMKEITMALVHQALSNMFPQIMARRLGNNPALQAQATFPVVELVDIPEPSRRMPVPMMPIQISENTTVGNIQILEDIFRNQLGLSDGYFESRPAVLVGGDAKTVNRMWSAIYSAGENISAYDQLKHVVPIPGLFHAQMHLMETIVKTHWGEPSKKSGRCNHSSLRYSAGNMARKYVSPIEGKPVFSHMRTFVMDVLYGKIVAEFYVHLIRGNRSLSATSSDKELEEAFAALGAKKLKYLVERTATTLKEPLHQVKDLERRENLGFVRDAEIYVILTHGIKHGDIGLIRYAVDFMAVMFNGSKKTTYTRVMIYLKHLIDTAYTSPEIQRAIAGSLLVNPSGRRDGFYAIDLANEFLNRDIKAVWANRRTSTTTVKDISEYCTIDAIYLRALRLCLHTLWGRNVHGKHTHSNRASVIRHLARGFYFSMKPDSRRSDAEEMGLAWCKNIYALGWRNLETILKTYNERFLYDVELVDQDGIIVPWLEEGDTLPPDVTANSSSIEEVVLDAELLALIDDLPAPDEDFTSSVAGELLS